MSINLNKVIIAGHLGDDPNALQSKSGLDVTRISVASTQRRKNKDTGETKEYTQWHRVVFFGKTANIVAEYFKKGDPIYVEGELRTSEHTGEDGVKKYYTDIIASQFQFVANRKDKGGDAAASPPATGADAPADFSDDDIPF